MLLVVSCDISSCYATGDSIELSICKSRFYLRDYPSNRDEVIEFFTSYQGEAQNSAAAMELLLWGLKEPYKLQDLWENVPDDQRDALSDRIVTAVHDGGFENRFISSKLTNSGLPIAELLNEKLNVNSGNE